MVENHQKAYWYFRTVNEDAFKYVYKWDGPWIKNLHLVGGIIHLFSAKKLLWPVTCVCYGRLECSCSNMHLTSFSHALVPSVYCSFGFYSPCICGSWLRQALLQLFQDINFHLGQWCNVKRLVILQANAQWGEHEWKVWYKLSKYIVKHNEEVELNPVRRLL